MGVGLNLSGKFAQSQDLEAWFNQVWEWMTENYPGMAMGAAIGQGPRDPYPKVEIKFHPAADPVRIALPDASSIQIQAETVSAGPGYHLFLCDLLWSLSSKFAIAWDAETDDGQSNPSFYSGDAGQTYEQMFSWLASMAKSASMMSESNAVYLSLPPAYKFAGTAPLITPMGPRDKSWLERVLKNPQSGADVFPWLRPELSAEYFLNKALAFMWTDLRWVPPLGDGDEALMRAVTENLAKAYALNSALDFPYKEWAEILSYLNSDDPLRETVLQKAREAQAKPAPAIGYRRNDVRAILDQGWSVALPGYFSEMASFDPQSGNHTWQFGSDSIMIWFTTYPTYGDTEGNIMPVAEGIKELDELQASLGTLLEEDSQGKIWRQNYMSEPKQEGQAFRFSSIFLVPGRLALSHVFSQNKADLDFARKFFASVENSADANPSYIEQPRFPRMDLAAAN